MSMSTAARRTGALASTALATAALISSLVVTPAAADQPTDRGTPPPQAQGHSHSADAGSPSNDKGNGQAAGEAPGNRGTVKIHEVGTPEDDRRNEPHVCDFEIVGFGFPDDANLEITIDGHGGPNAGSGTFTSTVTADQLSDSGDWVVDGPTLPDGMYKLYVDNTTAPGGAKQKVFKVDCPDEGGPVVGGDDDETGGGQVGGDDSTGGDQVGGEDVGGHDTTGGDQVLGGVTGTTGGTTAPAGGTQVLGEVLTRDLPAVVPAAAAAPAPQAVGASALARTGAEMLQLTVVGSALLLAGGMLVRLARRRALG